MNQDTLLGKEKIWFLKTIPFLTNNAKHWVGLAESDGEREKERETAGERERESRDLLYAQ